MYSKSDCPLCEEAENLVRHFIQESNLEIIDIIGDEELENQFIFRIPVLVCGDRVIAEGRITPADLAAVKQLPSRS